MDRRPTVSVVIPCFNQGRFLGEAIHSTLQQTYPAVEVIVVNDGSSDNTAAVALRFQATIVEQANRGTAAARNAGLRRSRGDCIVFLDADDRLLPDAVATGVESLLTHPDWAFAAGHVCLIDQDGAPAGIPVQDHASNDFYVDLLRSNFVWTPGAVMYRRSILDGAGAFDSWGGGSQDYELNIRIARRFAVGCHHRVILEYRRHPANMSADAAFMLKSAMRVRRAQRRHVRGNRAAQRALAAGIETVQADFGQRLVERVKADIRTPGRRRRALDAMFCLLRYYPAGLLTVVSDGARRLSPHPFQRPPAPARRPRE